MNPKQKRWAEFGSPLYVFLNRKFGSIKKASEVFGISASLISQFIHSKKPSQPFRNKATDLGFDPAYFDKLDAIMDSPDLDLLSYDEIKFLYYEMKYMYEGQKRVVEILENRIKELSKFR